MSWTEQQIQMLKEMWGHGFSASDIAGRLGSGLTRNAVIGKAHRLKLSAGLAARREGAANLRTGAPVSAAATMKSTRKRVMLRPLPVLPTPASTTAMTKSAVQREALRSPIDGMKRSEGVAVTKAGDRQCRWPVGDPRSPDFRFCGCGVHEGLPYCIDHARVAYQNVGKKFRAQDVQDMPTVQRMSSQQTH